MMRCGRFPPRLYRSTAITTSARLLSSTVPTKTKEEEKEDAGGGGGGGGRIVKRHLKKGEIREERFQRIAVTSYDDTPFPDALVHRTGKMQNGAFQYFLLPKDIPLIDALMDQRLALASIVARKNVIFGARLHLGAYQATASASASADEKKAVTIVNVCPPLLEAALRDADGNIDQLQALCTLYGLCDWVVDCLQEKKKSSVLEKLIRGEAITHSSTKDDQKRTDVENNETKEEEETTTTTTTTSYYGADLQLEAVRAIATRTPRPGHRIVGKNTFATAKDAWVALAREFVLQQPTDECLLYQASGAALVRIEHLADTNARYIASAGGAMATFFFL